MGRRRREREGKGEGYHEEGEGWRGGGGMERRGRDGEEGEGWRGLCESIEEVQGRCARHAMVDIHCSPSSSPSLHQVTPLTALKFAELTVKAGFPPGVINILPGKGRLVGQALVDNMDVRKIGFTGSTEVGKQIMKRYGCGVGWCICGSVYVCGYVMWCGVWVYVGVYRVVDIRGKSDSNVRCTIMR